MKKIAFFLGLLGILAFNFVSNDWPDYLGGPDRNHFSKLTQINKNNLTELDIAWTYSMPDSGQMQSNPLIIQGILYGISSTVQAFALDASTGKEIWRFGDPLKNWAGTSRGVSYWTNGSEARILFTAGPNLWALDAKTGKPIPTFGNQGKVDLHTGLPLIAQNKFIVSNTPGTVFNDLIIMPLRLSEGADAAPGDIRAFHVLTGQLVWTFHTIPYPGEYGYSTFSKNAYKNESVGAANNWAGMALDQKRGILFVPTGSAGFDFWGGNRKGTNLFANCLLALDAKTGKRLWHFQTTHHDIWDRDLPAPPNLIQIKRNGKIIDAVAQVTKQGFVFVFDRVSGKSLFPIQERKVGKSKLIGEEAWPTQPFPLLPKPYARLSSELSENDISPYAENREELIAQFRKFKKGWNDAPSTEGTLIFPGFDGGAEWGGAAANPETGMIYVNSNEMAWVQTMVSTKSKNLAGSSGEKAYQRNCMACHKEDRKGNVASGYPSLVEVYQKRNKAFVKQIIAQGKGMMPGFSHLSKEEQDNITAFIMNESPKEILSNQRVKGPEIPYRMTGYNKFLDNKGLPALGPPWGTLNAIDLNTGQYIWKIPFGDEPELTKKGIVNTGAENYGGPVITANGLIFIAAAKDAYFRIFDAKNGELLWKKKLPAAGFATPSTYMAKGKQYIVIACGGTKLGTPKGNSYVAFALKK